MSLHASSLYGRSPHIVIAGGGIAGLTTALSLHAAGFERVTVVEAAAAIRPVGAGLNLMPNAVRELDALGLLDALEAGALRTRELRYYHRSGGLISREPRGLGAGYRWPQLSVHRAHLQQVLAGAVRARLGAAALVTGVRVTGVEPLPDGRPRLRLEHRSGAVRGRASLEPDVLVGADGIRSAVRAALHPGEGGPPWNGMLVWRGVSRMPARAVGSFMLIAGDDRQKAVVYPMGRPTGPGREVLVNWALARPAEPGRGPSGCGAGEGSGFGSGFDSGPGSGAASGSGFGSGSRSGAASGSGFGSGSRSGAAFGSGFGSGSRSGAAFGSGAEFACGDERLRGDWDRSVPVETFLHHYEGWEFDGVSVPDVLRAADSAHEYPMVDREPLDRWTHGRTTLVGDAAHAMYPTGSNGATQAIVDARALAHALARHDDPAEGLAAYESARRPAMTALQRANRRLGPEVVINLAHERAPHGFTDIHDVLPAEELAAVAGRYAATGAFDPDTVNQGSPYEVPLPAIG
ncbi:FAD-dependent monooxygenase [Streptomyces sp. NPDC053253]|uniref:FAD-dependent monooxygenase n=1 Tax=Streptomyces sp. NPDC053253 TaxID=3365699 RepID=UPI0037D5E421